MLNQFLTELNKKNPNIKFIWRAEKQGNGNIHFHILTDKYVQWSWIATTWNRILKKEGYLLAYQTKFKNMWFEEYAKTIKDFKIDKIHEYKKRYLKQQRENWSNPPSTHVEDMRTAKKLVQYMSKYLTKNSHDPEKLDKKDVKKFKVEGHLYYCSNEINQISAPSEMISNRIAYELSLLYKLSPDSFMYDDFLCVIRLPIEDIFNLGCFELYRIFAENLNSYKPPDIFKPK